MTRSLYLAWLLVLGFLPTALSWVLNPNATSIVATTILMAVGAIVLTVFRLRNIGQTGWRAVLVIIPVLGEIFILWCLIIPSGFAQSRRLDLPAKIAAVPAVLVAILFLATILYPLIHSGPGATTKRTQARNDASQIALAISAYQTEYGYLPTASKTDVIATTDNSAVMAILSPPTTDPTPLNPRAITFLEIPKTTNGGNGRLNGVGSYLDPWGNPYLISLDGDGDGSLHDPLDTQGLERIQKRVLVWSKGDPAKPADYNNPAKWLESWQ